jgi:hypothetical protein
MGFAVRSRADLFKEAGREVCEVGYTNLWGNFRIQDVWSPNGGTRDECEEFVERIKAAQKEIAADILSRRPK